MVSYDADRTRNFYDAYGSIEWDRLDATAYGRLKAIIHADFIGRYVASGDRVLDAGSGPGRFSIVAAERGARVTALDLSGEQIQIAMEKIGEAGLLGNVEDFVHGDITDLAVFPEGHFDAVVCYGGALSYVCERRHEAAAELVRVVRPGGVILISVMSRYGASLNLVRRPSMPILQDAEGWNVWGVVEGGDLDGFPSTQVGMLHPPMHLFTSEELRDLLPGCNVLEIAGSNVTTFEGSTSLEEVFEDSVAWSTAVRLERELNGRPGIVDTGSHIIMAARRKDE
ncbi:MAG: class I SAM-dependent methyltransferase [Dehalococcoidia bacterium]|nr:class I SAM-dependent methyltransferase [Dehalococcoidia bacterium]